LAEQVAHPAEVAAASSEEEGDQDPDDAQATDTAGNLGRLATTVLNVLAAFEIASPHLLLSDSSMFSTP
jgi:hypothetical protein